MSIKSAGAVIGTVVATAGIVAGVAAIQGAHQAAPSQVQLVQPAGATSTPTTATATATATSSPTATVVVKAVNPTTTKKVTMSSVQPAASTDTSTATTSPDPSQYVAPAGSPAGVAGPAGLPPASRPTITNGIVPPPSPTPTQ